MRRTTCWGLCLTLLVGFSAQALATARQLSETPASKYVVVVFGDSLSDSGNLFKRAGIPDPAVYYQGRFSNGPVWPEYLAESYASNGAVKLFNYASGGAVACANNSRNSIFPAIRDLNDQTVAFVADVRAGSVTLDAETKLVVIQWIGGNDLLAFMNSIVASGRTPTPAEAQAAITAVLQCRLGSLVGLVTALRVPMEIAVVPMSPIAIAPAVPVALKPLFEQLEVAMGAATVKAVAKLCTTFLKAKPGQPGYGVHLHNIGINSHWITDLRKQVRPKFKYLDTPCFIKPISSLVITPGVKTCNNSNEYSSYDQIHPTTLFHKWFALYGLAPRLQRIGLLP